MAGGWKPKADRELLAYEYDLFSRYGGFMSLAEITAETGYKKQAVLKGWLQMHDVPAFQFGGGNQRPRLKWKTADVAAAIEKSKQVVW